MNTQKERMVSKGYKMSDNTHKSVVKMLQKAYPNYKDEYVLWLDFNFYSKYERCQVDAKIELYDENWRLIQTVADTVSDVDSRIGGLIRKPYPNKKIEQIGMKSGRKRIYGFPLLFDTFTELSKIAHIRVTWDIYQEVHIISQNEDKKISYVYLNQLILDFNTHFVKSDEKWYTIHSQDELDYELQEVSDEASPEEVERHKEFVTECDAKFDYKCGYKGVIDVGTEIMLAEYNDSYWGRIISDEMITDDMFFDNELQTLSGYNFDFDRILEVVESVKPTVKYEINFNRTSYTTSLEIKPEDNVAFLISSCFGFE